MTRDWKKYNVLLRWSSLFIPVRHAWYVVAALSLQEGPVPAQAAFDPIPFDREGDKSLLWHRTGSEKELPGSVLQWVNKMALFEHWAEPLPACHVSNTYKAPMFLTPRGDGVLARIREEQLPDGFWYSLAFLLKDILEVICQSP